MKFIGPKLKLELDITSGPDVEGWCKLAIRIASENGDWQSPSDACLMFDELKELEAFFEADINSDDVKEIDFMEPELSFKLNRGVLDVTLLYRLCPPWVESDEGYTASFAIDEKSMVKACSYIKKYRHDQSAHRTTYRRRS